jgi:conjugal transfer pilus assembly protein TraK
MTFKTLTFVSVLALCAGIATQASADALRVKSGSVEIDLSATQMSRIVIQGEKITAVRSLDDPSGPQVLTQNDPATGDLFVGFDGDTAGRTFSVFATTDQGETIQLLLHPGDGPARTLEIQPEGRATEKLPTPALRSNGYAETVTAFMKLMFNNQVTDGVTYEPADDKGQVTDRLNVRTVGYYRAAGLRGIVLFVTNRDSVPRTLRAEHFLVAHVIAAGVSNELLEPGASARVYSEEEAQ